MMRTTKKMVLTLTAVGLLVVGLGMFAGSTVGAGSRPSSAATVPLAAASSSSSTDTFNFSSPAPVWNSGNLCVVQQSGTTWTCNYTGPTYHSGWGGYGGALWGNGDCGCSSPSWLIYNFSMNHTTLNVGLSNLSKKVAIDINIMGSHNTITLNVTGDCQGGGTLNVTVLGEYDQVNFVNSANGVSSSFAVYENHDGYSAQISGSGDRTSTTFAAANPKINKCGWSNATRKDDTVSLSFTGWADSQSLVWVNAQGYNSGPNVVYVGHWNFVSYENTTTFSCYWAFPLPSTCHHHGWGPSSDLIATSRD